MVGIRERNIMSGSVLLSKIVEALDIQSDENSSFLDKNTMEVVILTHSERDAKKNGD